MRQPHYIKPNHRTQLPRHCIWTDTETRPVQLDHDTEAHYLEFGWACYARRKRDHTWTRPQWIRYTTTAEFWAFVLEHAPKRARLYVYAHNWGFDAPVLEAFHFLPERGWTCKSPILDGPPTVITYLDRETSPRGSPGPSPAHSARALSPVKRTITLVDTLNYWRMSLAKLGRSVGLDKLDMPDFEAPPEVWDTYARRDVEIIVKAVMAWIRFIGTHDLGCYSITSPAQAMNAYRHRFMPPGIYCDAHPYALQLSRQALHGGRTECFTVGNVAGPLHLVDVNSLYPSVMVGRPYPMKLRYCGRGLGIDKALSLARENCLIAQARLEVERPAYGVVIENRLVFPVGRLETTLTTPELQRAKQRGELRELGLVAVYTQGEIFRAYVEYFWALRRQAQAAGDEVASDMAKLMMNSLYGKFGQRGKHWEDAGVVPVSAPIVWVETHATTLERTRWRTVAGLLQKEVDHGESFHSHPAIAAHVTAYARLHMAQLIERAGPDHVHYMDTDSLLVDETGLSRLKGALDEASLGRLKLEGTFPEATLYGPKDYVMGSKRRTKGVRRDATWTGSGEVRQIQFSGLKGMLLRGEIDAPRVRTITKRLKREYRKGTVLPSGRVAPLRLRQW